MAKYHQNKRQYNLFLHKTDSVGYVAKADHKEFTFNIPNFTLSKNAKLAINSIASTDSDDTAIYNIRCKELNPLYNYDSKRDYPLIYCQKTLSYDGYDTDYYILSNPENLNTLSFVITTGLGNTTTGIDTTIIDFLIKVSIYDDDVEEVKNMPPVKTQHFDNNFFPK